MKRLLLGLILSGVSASLCAQKPFEARLFRLKTSQSGVAFDSTKRYYIFLDEVLQEIKPDGNLQKVDLEGKFIKYTLPARFTISPVSIPIKVRYSNDDEFTTEPAFNFAALVGFHHESGTFTNGMQRRSSIVWGAFVGPQPVIVNDGTEATSELGISFGLGLAYAPTGKLQFGLFWGVDYLDSDVNWGYQGKPWLGFGLGYSLANPTGGK